MLNKKQLLSYLVFAFFPKRCDFCSKVIAPAVDVCEVCRKAVLRVTPPVCRLCGRGKEECLCQGHQCFYSALAAPFYYEGPVQKCIWQLKFHGQEKNAVMLALEMSKTAQTEFVSIKFDLVTFVPLTKSSLNERGYNQSALLGNEVGRVLGIKAMDGLLKKLYNTPAQHTVSSSMRRGNLLGVFEVAFPGEVEGKTVLLCDDVATTGSTLNECSKMLLLAGAKEVYCLTAAVTRKNK